MDRGENGWLQPAGLQLATRQDVERLFVTNPHRIRLWQQFQEFTRQVNGQLIPVHAIWLDGSFISSKAAPADLDLVIFIDHIFFKSSRVALDALSSSMIYLDVKWAPVLNKSDELSSAIDALERMKWFILFSSDRSGLSKGFIDLKLD